MHLLFGLIVISISICVLALALKIFGGAATEMLGVANLRRKLLLTANEKEFFHRLIRALPQYHVFPQVAFSALLDTSKGLTARERFSLRNRFDRKFADFVICRAETLEVIAIVELDDRTHVIERDEKRDTMLRTAGYHIERFQSKTKPSEIEIARIFSYAKFN